VKRQAKSRPPKRPNADDLRPRPAPAPPPPGANAVPPLSEGVELEAQKLIHQAGSPSLAKRAVDKADERESVPDFRQDQFAARWGFASRKALLAASKPLPGDGVCSWWATAVEGRRWIVWSDDDMSAEAKFPSLEAAREWALHHGTADEEGSDSQE
jgi:hypothetical protein